MMNIRPGQWVREINTCFECCKYGFIIPWNLSRRSRTRQVPYIHQLQGALYQWRALRP